MGKRLKKTKEALTHPISAASSAVAAFGALLNPDVVFAIGSALYASAPSLFTGGSIAAFTLPQVFPTLAAFKPVFLAIVAIAGPLYLIRLVNNSTEIFEEKL
ncbi:hypothetical protein [Halobaculum rubrum]|uniref:hypothetical protein n=1 Tax=Halobaculum rubrum TaxID=2872158 RepID=UPI001CA3CE81|nr:hypothetical protein [Halobaculum rubrum]QZX98729.1 hypothetical protein K6T25_10635 [Halobaculum rubrum]